MSARSLRPGGTALRPGGVGRGYKGGAGSSTDYSSSRASSTGALSIDYRYTKDELMSIRPASAAPVPSHLRVLPSYVVRGAIGVKAGGQGTSVLVANEGQWGRGQQHGYPNQGRGGTGGGMLQQESRRAHSAGGNSQQQVGTGDHWVRHSPPPAMAPSHAHLTKTANPFLRGNQKRSKDFIAEVTCNVLAILNKLTPQTYEKLKEQLLELPINTAPLLDMLIGQIFDKVVEEAAFSELYVPSCRMIRRTRRVNSSVSQ